MINSIKKREGFSLGTAMIILLVVSIIIIANMTLLSMQSSKKTNVSKYVAKCILDETASDLTSPNCSGAIKGCRGGLEKDCETLFYYADSNPTPTYKVAREICDEGGELACKFFADKCVEDSALCDMTGDNDLNYYLNINSSDNTNPGRAYIEEIGIKYFDQGITDFKTTVNTVCSNEYLTSGTLETTACKIAGWQLKTFNYTFDPSTRLSYNEEDPKYGTTFDNGVVTLLPQKNNLNNTNWCWGRNDVGQLGDGTTTQSSFPVAVVNGLVFNSISAGAYHTCGLDPSGAAWCWGGNSVGELGNGTTTQSSFPVKVVNGHVFTSISVGSFHSCGIEDTTGKAWCWGGNTYGELGDGTTTQSSSPVAVVNGHVFTSIDAGWEYTCGLDPSGTAWCWGGNGNGQLGDGTIVQNSSPVAVTGGIDFKSIASGGYYACGLDTAGAAWCWGGNTYGELGDGTTIEKHSPVEVLNSDGSNFLATSIATGGYHTCGLDTAGAAWCWGRNTNGQLGNGTTDTPKTSPVEVIDGHVFTSISAGGWYTCGIDISQAAWCWGGNTYGELGDGTTNNSSFPVAVVNGHIFTPIDTGIYHTAAIAPKYKYYVTTIPSKNNIQDIYIIKSVAITETTSPPNSDTKWLISFDGGTQWKKLTGVCTWTDATTDLDTYDFSGANSYTDLQTDLVKCEPPSGSTSIDFAVDIETTDGVTFPSVDNIQIKYYPTLD